MCRCFGVFGRLLLLCFCKSISLKMLTFLVEVITALCNDGRPAPLRGVMRVEASLPLTEPPRFAAAETTRSQTAAARPAGWTSLGTLRNLR